MVTQQGGLALALREGIRGDIRAIGDSVGYRYCCLCFNSLEMKQHSDYKYPAMAFSKGLAIVSSILHSFSQSI
jgi:hypothetical protein